MTATALQLRRDAVSWRTVSSPTATQEQRQCAMDDLGVDYHDLNFAHPGETRMPTEAEIEIATPQSFRCIPIRSDYQPRPPRTWAAQAYDGAQSACAFAALGFVGGVMATVSVMLQVMAGWR